MELDLLFKNGVIQSVDKNNTIYSRLGIKDNKIVLLDNDESEVKSKKIVDLQGKLMLPGFNDTHIHVLEYADGKNAVDLMGTTSVNEILEKMKNHYAKNGLYQGWLLGNGWNQNRFTDGNDMIYKFDLDKISTEFPIMITRTCIHIAVLNSKGIELLLQCPSAKDNMEYIDIETGIIKESALPIYRELLEKHTVESVKKLLLSAQNDLIKEGITSVQSADISFTVAEEDFEILIQAYKELVKEKKMKVRTYEQNMFIHYEAFKKFVDSGYTTGQGDEYFKIGPLKIISDGSLGARTAYMTEDYADMPGEKGVLILDYEKMDKFVTLAKENNMQVVIHGIGDGAMEIIVDVLNKHNKENNNKMRDGIIHAQITTHDLIDKIKSGNICVHAQPVFIDYDMDIADDRVGCDKASTSYAWKTMLDKGIVVSGGSDAPVVSFNVLENIFFAVARKNINCLPENGWYPNEKVSVDEAVRMFTINAAYKSFEENIKGSLEIGKLADLVVLSDNIYEIEEDNIKDVKVDMTIFDGNIVFER